MFGEREGADIYLVKKDTMGWMGKRKTEYKVALLSEWGRTPPPSSRLQGIWAVKLLRMLRSIVAKKQPLQVYKLRNIIKGFTTNLGTEI